MGEQPRQILGRKQKYVQTDAHRAAEHAVYAAHAGVIIVARSVHHIFARKRIMSFPPSVLYAAPGVDAMVIGVAELLHARYVIRPGKQSLRHIMAREYHFAASAQRFRLPAERLNGKRPRLRRVDDFVQYNALSQSRQRAREQFPLPRKIRRAFFLVHLPEELVRAALRAQQDGAFKAPQRLDLAAVRALQKLADAHAQAVAQRPQRQASAAVVLPLPSPK